MPSLPLMVLIFMFVSLCTIVVHNSCKFLPTYSYFVIFSFSCVVRFITISFVVPRNVCEKHLTASRTARVWTNWSEKRHYFTAYADRYVSINVPIRGTEKVLLWNISKFNSAASGILGCRICASWGTLSWKGSNSCNMFIAIIFQMQCLCFL